MWAILNTKTGRLMKAEAESQTRQYDWESARQYPVIRVHDSCFPGIVYCQEEESAIRSLLDPDPKHSKDYKDVYIDYLGFNRDDLTAVVLIQVTS